MMKNPSDILFLVDKNSSKQKTKIYLKRKQTEIPEKPNNIKKNFSKKMKNKPQKIKWSDEILLHSK